MSDVLQPHGLQHSSLPCPSLSSKVCSNSCLLSRWCHPTISSSVIPFSSRLQSFPASGSFPMSQFFPTSCQSIGVSASTSVLPMNTQDWFPLEWTGWISLQSKGLSRVFFNTTVQKHQFFGTQFSLWSNSYVITWLLEYAVQVDHSFSSKEGLSFNFMAAVTICSDFGAQENKVCHYLIASPSIYHEVMG